MISCLNKILIRAYNAINADNDHKDETANERAERNLVITHRVLEKFALPCVFHKNTRFSSGKLLLKQIGFKVQSESRTKWNKILTSRQTIIK